MAIIKQILFSSTLLVQTTAVSYTFAQTTPGNVPEVVATTAVEVASDTKELSKPKKDKALEALPQKGILASVQSAGRGREVSGFGNDSLEGDTPKPVSGTVIRKPNGWEVTVKNNSKEALSINTALKQFKDTSKPIETKYLSFSLQSGESDTRVIPNSFKADGCTLEIMNWSK